ncbi:MAG TPA: (d)CMP kinase [Acidothermaceae bacterium]
MAADKAPWQDAAHGIDDSRQLVDSSTLVVAIDGPSGAGKSTVARGVARALWCRYLDTGAVYRALTWAVLEQGTDPGDEQGVAGVLTDFRLELSTDPADIAVVVGGQDVTAAIRGAAVTSSVSAVSAMPRVRTQLVAMQRSIIGRGGIVVEGRDIGTVVCPDADVKIFLTANSSVRATRRFVEHDDPAAGVDAVEADLARRDGLDANRTVSPLVAAADAIAIDSTSMDAASVIAVVLDIVAARAEARSTPR